MADELRETFPQLQAKLIDLLSRVAANDAELSRLHQARPADILQHLQSAELEARGQECVYALARSAFPTRALPNDQTAPGTRSLSARTAANAFRIVSQSASEMTREGSSLIV